VTGQTLRQKGSSDEGDSGVLDWLYRWWASWPEPRSCSIGTILGYSAVCAIVAAEQWIAKCYGTGKPKIACALLV